MGSPPRPRITCHTATTGDNRRQPGTTGRLRYCGCSAPQRAATSIARRPRFIDYLSAVSDKQAIRPPSLSSQTRRLLPCPLTRPLFDRALQWANCMATQRKQRGASPKAKPAVRSRGNHYILVVFDSCRHDSMVAARPRHIRKLGELEQRWSYASWTSPSHFNLLSGLLPHSTPRHAAHKTRTPHPRNAVLERSVRKPRIRRSTVPAAPRCTGA